MPEDFPQFELIPAGVDELDLDDELAELIDPADIPELERDDFEDLPLGRGWVVDMGAGTVGGRPQPIYGIRSVLHIAEVAMHTPRAQYPVFPDWFGMEAPEALIGHPDDTERRATYIHDLRNTLVTCHERITDVTDFEFLYDQDDEVAYLNATLEIDGEVDIPLEGIPVRI